MRFSLFHPASRTPTPASGAADDPTARRPEEPTPMCPPCTGNCFQGRACPASPTADPTLVALLRRSPQQ